MLSLVSFSNKEQKSVSDLDSFNQLNKKISYNYRNRTRWLMSHLFKYRLLIVVIALIPFFIAAFRNSVPMLVGILYGEITTTKQMSRVLFLVVLIVLATAFQALLIFCYRILTHFLGENIARDVREELYISLLKKNQAFHDQQESGEIVTRATIDVVSIDMIFSVALSKLYETFFAFLVPLTLIYLISPQLLLIPLLYTILFVVGLKRYDRKISGIITELRKNEAQLNTLVADSLQGFATIRINNLQKRQSEKFFKKTQKIQTLALKQTKITAQYPALLFLGIATAIGLLHAYLLLKTHVITFPQMIQFIGLMLLLSAPSQLGVQVFALLRKGLVSADRNFQLITSGKEELTRPQQKYNAPMKGIVEFKNVSFGYNSHNHVLKRCSFKVTPGQLIALVGMTGSGKTTLVNLIYRLYDVDKGQILIDGVDVRDWDLEALRSQIGVVEQEVKLFNRSIKDNISFGMNVSMKRIVTAAKLAQAHEFIMTFNDGYNTIIREGGISLSSGQRQRIALARMFLRDPRIIILDNFSSALDAKTEAQLIQTIRHHYKDRTVFVVTNRLSIIKSADCVLLLSNGQILASGSHKKLMSTCSEYQEIYETLDVSE